MSINHIYIQKQNKTNNKIKHILHVNSGLELRLQISIFARPFFVIQNSSIGHGNIKTTV